MVGDEHVRTQRNALRDRVGSWVKREDDARDRGVRVTGEQAHTVPVLGALGGKAVRDGPLHVPDSHCAHSSMNLVSCRDTGNATEEYPAAASAR